MSYAAQIIGFTAVGVSFFIYLQKSKKRILLYKLATDVLWVLHHLMIFSYPAAVTTSLSIFRELVFCSQSKKENRSRLWLFVFTALYAISAFVTCRDIYGIIPAAYSIVATFALWHKKISVTRCCIFCGSFCMLFYGIHYGSTATVINETLTMISIIIAIIMEYTYKKNNQKGR